MSQSSGSGQTRRKFVGRVRLFNERRRREFAEAGFPLVPEDALTVLEDYLDISRRRHLMLMPLFKLQLHILQDLIVAEQMTTKYKARKAELLGQSARGAEAESSENDDDDALVGDEEDQPPSAPELRSINREMYFLKAEARVLRDIADGIAWRLFDYDRGVLHELARRPTKQYINLQGLQSELYTLAAYCNDRSGIGILNDLTNFLKFGDVTVRLGPNEFEIVEVKAGTSGSGRLTRQRQGLTELVSLLSVDQGRSVQGAPMKISSVDVEPEIFIGNLRSVLDRAEINGAAVESIGSHLVMECIDFTAIRRKQLRQDAISAVLERGRSIVEQWTARGDFLLPLEVGGRYAHAQNFVPLSIFPLPPSRCVRLAFGAISIYAFVNISAVLRGLETRGWTVVRSPEQLAQSQEAGAGEIPIAVLRKRRLTTHVPASLVGRLGMEFLKPKSLAHLLDAILEQHDERGFQFVNFERERALWW